MSWGRGVVRVAMAGTVLTGLVGLTSTSPVGALGAFGANVRIGQGTAGVSDTEPSIRVADDGTVYVGAIKGLPSGSDFWRSDNGGTSFRYLGSPDSVAAATPIGFCCAAVGGGDEDFAVDAAGNIGWSSLTLASVTVGRSTNKGASFTVQPLGSPIPGVDREWNASDGSTFYMSFHDIATDNIDILRSAAGATGGLAYTPAGSVFPTTQVPLNELGNLVADRQHPGTLYQVYVAPSTTNGAAENQLAMAVSRDGGATWTHHVAFTGPASAEYGSVFPVAAIDRSGNLFAAITDQHNGVLVFSSADGGTTWSGPTNVSALVGAASVRTVFPWIAAAGNGGVVVTWMGAASNPGTWNVYAAEATDGAATTPTYSAYTVSDHVVHSGSICTEGTGCSDGRQLGDFYQVAVDPAGFANIAWADDGSSAGAQVFFAKGGVALGLPN